MKLAKVWQSKKWLAFSISVIVCGIASILNARYDWQIDANQLLALFGLNSIYILAQGSIDSKKTGQSPLKMFYESNKFFAVIIGDLIPLGTAWVAKEFNVTIPANLIIALIGLDAIYTLRQSAIDIEEPDKH